MYLYGAGGHSKVVADVLESLGIGILGVFDDDPPAAKFTALPVRPGIRRVGKEAFPKLNAPVILSLGRCEARAEVAALLEVEYGCAVHASAVVARSVRIGSGTVVLHGAVIQADSMLGAHVLVNTAASIDHDNRIDDFAHIAPHATLCGHVHVGEGSQIGAGAVVTPEVRIGKWCSVGAGAVVIRDLPDYSVAVGVPARVIKHVSRPRWET